MKKEEAMNRGERKFLRLLKERWLTCVGIVSLILFLLMMIQDLSGVLWNYERPLAAEKVIKQEQGAFRLLLNAFDVNVPERLTERVQIFEDGRSLPRYRTKYQLHGSSAGFFVFGNKLWVKPRSGEPKNLVGRFPVEVSGRARALLWGATFLVILAVVAWTPERERWKRFIVQSVAASKRSRRRLAAIAVRHSSAMPFSNDLLALLLLALIAAVIYFPRVNDLHHTADGFYLSHLMEIGELRLYSFVEAKEPGRPFLGLGWNLAAVLGGGSVVGYYLFMFSCVMLSAMMVYAIVRTLLPSEPLWALLGSALKLVWAANLEVFENHSVAIYFAEFQFWLATFLFVRLAVSRASPRRIEIFLAPIVITTSLVTAAGTYQTAWPVILLPPIFLIASGFMRWRSRRSCLLLALWYLSTIPMMLWCSWLSYRYAQTVSPSILEVLDRLLYGFRAATWESVLHPFMPFPKGAVGVNGFVALIILLFMLIVVWFGLQSFPPLRRQARGRSTRVIAVLIVTSLAVIGGSLLLPSVLYRPEFGTRFMHWPSVGTIALIVTFLASLSRARTQVSGNVSAALAVVLFSSMIHRMHAASELWVEVSHTDRSFWEGIITVLPNVTEGTVILMEGPPAGVGTTDILSTWIFRALTETRSTYVITESAPEYRAASKVYDVSSLMDLNREAEPFDPNVNLFADMGTEILNEAQAFPVPADQVVWLSWDPDSRLLMVDPERSAMERINKDVRSNFGGVLFPEVGTGESSTP